VGGWRGREREVDGERWLWCEYKFVVKMCGCVSKKERTGKMRMTLKD
jgi:hypothetical protein